MRFINKLLKNKYFWRTLEFLPYLFVFLYSLYPPSDPDLGWHLKYGEYFFQHHKLLDTNTFATLMPDFKWANGSWGTDVITYAVYHYAGFIGLTIFSALIVTLTLFFAAKAGRLRLIDKLLLFPLVLYLEEPLNMISFRGQLLTILFIMIMFYILSKYSFLSKKILCLPLLLLFWANIHEQCFLALALFGLWIALTIIRDFYYAIKKRNIIREAIYLGTVFFLCFLVTFINPYGWGIHLDALSHFGNPLLKSIVEYLPFPLFSQDWWNQVLIAVIGIIGLLILFFHKSLKFHLPALATACFLLVYSFEVKRYAWPSYYLMLPVLSPVTYFFIPAGRRIQALFSIVILVISFTVLFIVKSPFQQYFNMSWKAYCFQSSMQCSPAASKFIIDHQLTKNVFSLYGWGGWLIWNYPEIKPGIDGRMHLWRDEKGYSGFAEYYEYEQGRKNIDNWKTYDVVYMSPNYPIFQQLEELSQQGKWRVVYTDSFAGVFVRNK